jgi:hypothetical protein
MRPGQCDCLIDAELNLKMTCRVIKSKKTTSLVLNGVLIHSMSRYGKKSLPRWCSPGKRDETVDRIMNVERASQWDQQKLPGHPTLKLPIYEMVSCASWSQKQLCVSICTNTKVRLKFRALSKRNPFVVSISVDDQIGRGFVSSSSMAVRHARKY